MQNKTTTDMKRTVWITAALGLLALPLGASAQRTETLLKKGWRFTLGEGNEQTVWQTVDVPHDWAF